MCGGMCGGRCRGTHHRWQHLLRVAPSSTHAASSTTGSELIDVCVHVCVCVCVTLSECRASRFSFV